MKKIIVLSVLMWAIASFAQKPAYVLFDSQGNKIEYNKMIKYLTEADFVMFGEYHNNPISHWLEYEVTKDIHKIKGDKMILGAEMFETDNQRILDEYIEGLITTKNFESECRLWPNYKTDYKPLVEFAKKNNLTFVATNVPRHYANVVMKKGFEGLEAFSDEAKKLMAPLPVKYDPTLKCYENMMKMDNMPAHVTRNFPHAQALKDATMAFFALKYWKQGYTFIHYNGAYHSDNHEGIVWFLKKNNPKLNIKTITTVSQKNIEKLKSENKGLADYIICVVEDMTTTY